MERSQRSIHVGMGYEHDSLGSEEKYGASQVLGKDKTAAEEQEGQQQGIIVLDDTE
jgi:hypothetical protein